MAATLGTQPQLAHDGWPLVESESSLLDFLNLCHTGARVNSEVLQCTVQKNEDGLWTGYGEKDLTSLELLLGFRAELLQYDKEMTEADLERTLMSIDPVDSIKIKREVAAGGEQEDDDSDDDDANQKGVRLAIIDVTGDGGPVETDTFDAGASSSSAKPLSHTPAYIPPSSHSLGPGTSQVVARGTGWLLPGSYGDLRLVFGSYGQICDSPLLHLSIQVDPGSYPKYSVPLHLRLPADSAAGDATATSRDSLLDDMAAFPSPTPSEIAKAAPESPSVEPGAPAIAQEAAPLPQSSPAPSLPNSEAEGSTADEQALIFIIYL